MISNSNLRSTLTQLCLGQLVSLDMAVMSFTASLISAKVDIPLTLSLFTYSSLAMVYGSIMLYRRHKLLTPWYWYILLGFVDVHGNYLFNKAFQFTSITSVTILDCWTIAWVMVLTWLILRTKYSLWQFIGAAICVGGLGLVLLSDAGIAGGGGSRPLLGDFLVIAGTLFYAMSNVGEEYCVKKKDATEVLAMIGLFGMLVSASEIAVVERKTLATLKWSSELVSILAIYGVASFLFYTLMLLVLKNSGSTLFNLSLLTSDMWAVAARILFYKQKVDWLFYLAFAIVFVGIFIYSKTEKEDHDSTKRSSSFEDARTSAFEYHRIDEENLNNDSMDPR